MGLRVTRKVGQIICIGDDIGVVITAINKTTVEIEVRAPNDVAVDRLELRQAKIRDKSHNGRRKNSFLGKGDQY